MNQRNMNLADHYTPEARYEDTAAFFARHYYLGEPRHPVTLEQVDIRRLAAMEETLVDALHLVLLMEDLKEPLANRDITFVYPKDGTLPPAYVMEALGDYREAPSFFRWDKPRYDPSAPRKRKPSIKLPDAIRGAEAMHRQSRNMGSAIGQWFNKIVWDDANPLHTDIKREVQHYDALLARYRGLMEKYGDASKLETEGAAEYERFCQEFGKTVGALKEHFRKLTSFTIEDSGKRWEVPNAEPLNPAFASSLPALTMFAFRKAGKEGIDTDVHPLLGFHLLTDILGVESDLHLVMHSMEQHLTAHVHRPVTVFTPARRRDIQEALEAHAHGMQLLYTFHRVAGWLEDVYPEGYKQLAHADMEQFLKWAGKNAWLERIETPKEAAALLYAVERRLTKEGIFEGENAALQPQLRAAADSIAAAADMTALQGRQDQQLRWTLMRARRMVEEQRGMDEVTRVLTQLEQAILAEKPRAAQVHHPRTGRDVSQRLFQRRNWLA